MDPFITGLAIGMTALVDRVLERRAHRNQRGRLMALIAELPPAAQVGEWRGNEWWWVTLPQQAIER